MHTPAPSLIGVCKTELDTPTLLVDLDVMEANIGRVAEICRTSGVGWRPHTKGQKTPEIIRKELAAGAIGVTCAKLGEAEVLAATGIRDILIANQIVGPAKMRRLIGLLRIADPIVGAHVDELGAVLQGSGLRICPNRPADERELSAYGMLSVLRGMAILSAPVSVRQGLPLRVVPRMTAVRRAGRP